MLIEYTSVGHRSLCPIRELVCFLLTCQTQIFAVFSYRKIILSGRSRDHPYYPQYGIIVILFVCKEPMPRKKKTAPSIFLFFFFSFWSVTCLSTWREWPTSICPVKSNGGKQLGKYKLDSCNYLGYFFWELDGSTLLQISKWAIGCSWDGYITWRTCLNTV
jgi:hypothetical protein